jgi:type II secretory pathway pseudopilin PulG
MTDPAPAMSGPLKAILIGLGIVVLAGGAALVLLKPGASSCQGVFEQTAPRLEANIELIKNKGGFAVSQEKVQELTEGAQKVGLHLKTCCSVLEGGKLNPDQFQQCIARASAYDRQIAETARQVDVAATAQAQGQTAVVEQQKTQIASSLKSAASEVTALGRQVAQLSPKPSGQPDANTRSGSEGEPNDNKASAADLASDTPIDGEIASTEDHDNFRFMSGASVRDRVIVRLENRSDTLRPYVKVFGPDKAALQESYSSTAGADTELAFTAQPGKRYYVEVNPYGTSGKYTLTALPQAAFDRFEPNDDPIHDPPTPLTVGESIDANILDEQDNDWYRLAAAPGESLRITLENRSTTLRPHVLVYNAQRSKIEESYDTTVGASLDISVDTTAGLTYYLQVKPFSSTSGDYRLTVR